MADEFDSDPPPATLYQEWEAEARRTGTTVAEVASAYIRNTRLKPSAAAEALEIWRKGVHYLGDDPLQRIEDVYTDANRVLQIAKTDGVELEELVPDAKERQELIDDAKEFDRTFDLEDPRAV